MQPDQRDAAYLWDMLDATRTLEQLISGLDFPQYSNDRRTQLAVERSLEIIGQRNVLIHEYGEIKQERIWKTVRENVPQLIELLKPFV